MIVSELIEVLSTYPADYVVKVNYFEPRDGDGEDKTVDPSLLPFGVPNSAVYDAAVPIALIEA